MKGGQRLQIQCGNIQCIDVLRALNKEPETREAFFAELLAAKGAHADLDREIGWLSSAFDDVTTLELRSRMIVERMALALQASVLLRAGVPGAELFATTRLGGEHGLNYGTLPADAPFDAMMARAAVA